LDDLCLACLCGIKLNTPLDAERKRIVFSRADTVMRSISDAFLADLEVSSVRRCKCASSHSRRSRLPKQEANFLEKPSQLSKLTALRVEDFLTSQQEKDRLFCAGDIRAIWGGYRRRYSKPHCVSLTNKNFAGDEPEEVIAGIFLRKPGK
jgi:hypothetical protein